MRILAHMLPDLIRSAEAADMLDMSQSTFNRKAAAGEIVAALTLGGATGARLFRRSDIEKLAARLAKAS